MNAEYRDPRNDHTVDVLVEAVERKGEATCDAIKALHDHLDHDIELTPQQADRLARILGHVGMAASHVLLGDFIETALREEAEAAQRDELLH